MNRLVQGAIGFALCMGLLAAMLAGALVLRYGYVPAKEKTYSALIAGVAVEIAGVEEGDGCLSGTRIDTGQVFKFCGDYLLIEND